jgi:hypothetical protein
MDLDRIWTAFKAKSLTRLKSIELPKLPASQIFHNAPYAMRE